MPELIEQISTSLEALTKEFEIITNNLANVSTTGFKRRCNAFSTFLEAQKAEIDEYSPGTINLESAFDFSQGNLNETGRPLDLALFGKGFFVIETPNGPLYTRNGTFTRNENGQITDINGQIVAGDAGPITIPNNVENSKIHVSSDGTISAGGINIGKFRLVDFQDNESKLISTGESCYMMPDNNIIPVAAENIAVKQGYQEASNVKMIDELVDMIMVSRLYEANVKFIAAKKEISSSLMGLAMA
jgi:flagellar basal body rod protein FlgG